MYTCSKLLPDAEFTPAIMVSVYVVPQNRWRRNIFCLIQNRFLKGIVTYRMALCVVAMIIFLERLIPIPYICVSFWVSTFGVRFPFSVLLSYNFVWLFLVRRQWLIFLVDFTSVCFVREAVVLIVWCSVSLDIWSPPRSISSTRVYITV